VLNCAIYKYNKTFRNMRGKVHITIFCILNDSIDVKKGIYKMVRKRQEIKNRHREKNQHFTRTLTWSDGLHIFPFLSLELLSNLHIALPTALCARYDSLPASVWTQNMTTIQEKSERHIQREEYFFPSSLWWYKPLWKIF
jgi:hypothetical protein